MANSSIRTCKESVLGLEEGKIASKDLMEEVITSWVKKTQQLGLPGTNQVSNEMWFINLLQRENPREIWAVFHCESRKGIL